MWLNLDSNSDLHFNRSCLQELRSGQVGRARLLGLGFAKAPCILARQSVFSVILSIVAVIGIASALIIVSGVDHLAKMNLELLKKRASAVQMGGKGTVRRKKKAVHKTTTTDDKRLQSTLKRLALNTIPGIEEVNIFKDENVIHFVNPKVQASIGANTYVVSGAAQTKKLQDLLPGIINQLGLGSLANLRKVAEQYKSQESAGVKEDDDDDVPDLVEGETFEEAAKEPSAP
eukprot:TRINITY_DN109_c0_g1_i1.p1 TRINITY_DN109_c0_g1~~TRINITY_DN109_c0_g1_i1.p1  ORF type:complete len:231 (+),score=58.94 TRINITY_DN109_c0_g1_i1:32-724(+)